MPEWNTRLAVQYTPQGGQAVTISPIDTFSPSFSLNAEALHSLEATHIGAIFSPPSINFSMTVKAIGNVVGALTALAMNGTLFDITLLEFDGDDWSFSSFVLQQCLITSASPTTATISGAPAATFSGFGLGAAVDAKSADPVKLP
ncbi:hypothetical protein OM076_11310 [Solirubrobacter ginsenosidimutans]|uniref:Uncharacterized protein n=1 Tax=Solirubrobacter ginsenosidimutans TaxID=490573 RepID=A0A9X3MQV4_9ACTN|nr:hypothetical protein [Solirubrobacter ginsenosidimutans]MDA0160854.1 hypothetical protein [Solirubrobacter ginsenosidimutans]